MNYIVLDLELNQDFSTKLKGIRSRSKYPFEIIQIGAIKLDKDFNTIDTFNRYVKPSIYKKVSKIITKITGITTDQLVDKDVFSHVYTDFLDFVDDAEAILCSWGVVDIKELYKNVDYHKLDKARLPNNFINVQSYVTRQFYSSTKQLIKLQNAVEALNIPIKYDFHNAVHDAYYTAEVFKETFNSSIIPKVYDPSYKKVKIPREDMRKIDFDALYLQFSKMHNRKITEDEKEMIKTAYLMGKTNQFLK